MGAKRLMVTESHKLQTQHKKNKILKQWLKAEISKTINKGKTAKISYMITKAKINKIKGKIT